MKKLALVVLVGLGTAGCEYAGWSYEAAYNHAYTKECTKSYVEKKGTLPPAGACDPEPGAGAAGAAAYYGAVGALSSAGTAVANSYSRPKQSAPVEVAPTPSMGVMYNGWSYSSGPYTYGAGTFTRY